MMLADLEWYEILLRLGLASVLGAVVGLERESAGQDAGFRTHLLLALGAGLFGVVSVGAFDTFVTDEATNVQVDVTRIASYVVAGVGFIGGGVIIKHAGSVRGITTAASLWVAAAIGLSAGVGLWVASLLATAIALLALAALKPLSDWVGSRARRPRTLQVVLDDKTQALAVVGTVQDEMPAAIRSISIGQGEASRSAEVWIEFWEQPTDDMARRIVERLQAEFADTISVLTLRA